MLYLPLRWSCYINIKIHLYITVLTYEGVGALLLPCLDPQLTCAGFRLLRNKTRETWSLLMVLGIQDILLSPMHILQAWLGCLTCPNHTHNSRHCVIVLPPARANTSCRSRVQNTWENKYRSPLIIGDIVKNFPVWIIHLIFCQHVVSQSENNPSDIPRSR